MLLLSTILFSLAVAWFLVRPHLAAESASVRAGDSPEMGILLDRKERYLQVLKDLQLDYDTKKISDTDYQQMRQSMGRDLAATLEAIDELSTPAK